jgi:hypothetical protein
VCGVFKTVATAAATATTMTVAVHQEGEEELRAVVAAVVVCGTTRAR